MNTRRDFIKSVLGAAAAGAAAPIISGCSKPAPLLHKLNELGVQGSLVGKMMREDWRAALKTIRDIGYQTIETGLPRDADLAEFNAYTREIGMTVISGGTSMAGLLEDLEPKLEQAKAIGNEFYVCFWPWADSGENKNIDDWKQLTNRLNEIGEKVNKAGLRFLYHNHDIEFVSTEGVVPFDLILQRTDPELVNLEIDLYWVRKGGHDPIHYLTKYPGRFPVWHVKDMNNKEEQDFACVGEGIIDFPAIFAKSEVAGFEHALVERDGAEDELGCITTSYEYLSNMTFTID